MASIVEQKSATPEQVLIREVNPGVYSFNARHFWDQIHRIQPNNAAREYYLTDMVEILSSQDFPVSPYLVADETELLGINTRLELSVADRILRLRKANELMLAGVTMEKPESISLDVEVEVGQDTYLEPGVQLRGKNANWQRLSNRFRSGPARLRSSRRCGDPSICGRRVRQE